jgi:hypothetical protein
MFPEVKEISAMEERLMTEGNFSNLDQFAQAGLVKAIHVVC